MDESLTPLLLGAGKILFQLQQLENVVKMCYAFLNIDDIHLTIDDLFSEDPKKRHYTLGQLLRATKKPIGFKPSFIGRLDSFVKSRNIFIHSYWIQNEIYVIDTPIDHKTYSRITSFEEKLYNETLHITQVFIGLHYSIGAVIASRESKLEELESAPEYDDMRKYVSQFLAVVDSEE